jgi:hypothetical protein
MYERRGTMKKLLSLVLVVTVFLFFTAGVFAQAKEEAAKAEAAKAAEAATAGISTGTIVAGVLVAAAIAAAIAAAGAPAKAAPTPSAVAQSAAQTLSTSNPQVAASLSTLAQTLAPDDAKNLGTFIARAANNAQSLSEFKTAIFDVDTVSEIEAAISGLAPAGVSELRTYLTSLKSRDPAAYNALLALLQHIVTVGKANSEAGNKMAKALHDAIVNIDTSKPEQVTAVVQAASAMAQDPTTFQVAYLTAMHPGYTITLTQTHIGGGVYMTVTHFTPKH